MVKLIFLILIVVLVPFLCWLFFRMGEDKKYPAHALMTPKEIDSRIHALLDELDKWEVKLPSEIKAGRKHMDRLYEELEALRKLKVKYKKQ